MRKINKLLGLVLVLLLTTLSAQAGGGFIQRGDYAGRQDVEDFVRKMHREYGLSEHELRGWLSQASRQQRVLDLIRKPAEGKPWSEYRPIFVNRKRIRGGLRFWRTNSKILEKASQTYGVPIEIIVAIIGVETHYGGNVGGFPVFDTLVTLGFDYPKRSKFFLKELENYMLLVKEESLSPFKIKGSYAGAMGMGQFIPSSYREYSVDFDGDGKRNLWQDTDAIGSVARYFNLHGWKTGEPVVVDALVQGNKYRSLKANNRHPKYRKQELKDAGVVFEDTSSDPQAKFVFLDLEGKDGREYRVGHHNFFVISEYNHSVKYALAVYQLSEALKAEI